MHTTGLGPLLPNFIPGFCIKGGQNITVGYDTRILVTNCLEVVGQLNGFKCKSRADQQAFIQKFELWWGASQETLDLKVHDKKPVKEKKATFNSKKNLQLMSLNSGFNQVYNLQVFEINVKTQDDIYFQFYPDQNYTIYNLDVMDYQNEKLSPLYKTALHGFLADMDYISTIRLTHS